MSRINTDFSKVVCINLAERPDKKEKMSSKFSSLGIESEWYTAVQYGFIPRLVDPIISSKAGHFNKNQPYEIGASLSHYHVIKQALIEGCESLFVFEDDVRFHKDFNNKLDDYMNHLPGDWDMILLYSFMYELLPQNIRASKRWIRSYRSWSLMAYGIREGAMKEYIKRQDKYFTIADLVTYQMQEDMNFKSYSAVPALCIPETSLGSNIRGGNMNYEYKPTIVNMGYSNDHYE
jgi:GR25 family glycosyltransferase involved in LPS biosynthesis